MSAPKTLVVVLGTRPEALKLIPVIRELKRHPEHFRVVVCSTGQHRQMLDQMLRYFEVPVDHDLDLMTPGQTLGDITARTLAGMRGVLEREKPAQVIVQGDTTTAFSAALAAFYAHVPVAHVEAGLRTHNKWSPYPEEINRRLIGVLGDWHYPPTALSRENLLRDGIPDERILITGNTVVDMLLLTIERLKVAPVVLPVEVPAGRRMILVTAHRRESFGETFREMCLAMREIVERHPEAMIVYPVHLNPNVRAPVMELLSGVERVHLLEPLDYLPFVTAMRACSIVLTDSGGVQEEAPALGKPVLVMRENTERPEGVTAGTAKLVGTSREAIVRETLRLLEDPVAYTAMAQAVNPYGDGHASERIAEHLMTALT